MADDISVNVADVIAADMRALDPATRKEVRPALRAAGEIIATDARGRASWSTRIPGTVRVQTSFREDREGVTVIGGGRAAPHAIPYEVSAARGFFRHPVHADPKKIRAQWTWVSQQARPFLFPAAVATEPATTAALLAALDAAPKSLGFTGG